MQKYTTSGRYELLQDVAIVGKAMRKLGRDKFSFVHILQEENMLADWDADWVQSCYAGTKGCRLSRVGLEFVIGGAHT